VQNTLVSNIIDRVCTYLRTTATPTGMQSVKLGHGTNYLRVIGQQELRTLRDRLTDKLITTTYNALLTKPAKEHI